jgi:hypothetical protein
MGILGRFTGKSKKNKATNAPTNPRNISVSRVSRGNRTTQEYESIYNNPLNYLPQPINPQVFDTMRQAIPIIDTALDKLSKLTGNPIVTWESEKIQTEWDLWAESVRVAPISQSLGTWQNGHESRTLLYGTCASNIVIARDGRDVAGLKYIPYATLKLRLNPDDDMDVIVAQQQGGIEPVILDRDFIVLNSHEPQDKSIFGRSLFANCPFIAELPIIMLHAEKSLWTRQGCPPNVITVEIEPDSMDPGSELDFQQQVNAYLDDIEKNWTDAQNSRNTTGEVKDFFGAGKFTIKTVGSDLKEIEFNIPYRAAIEQIIGVTHLPPFMLGMHWSTTERLSEEQAQSLERIVTDYQADFKPGIAQIADWWARCRGYANADREITWPTMDIRDRVELARAELFKEQAVKSRIENGRALWNDGIFNQQRYADYVTGEESTAIEEEMDKPSSALSAVGTALPSNGNGEGDASGSNGGNGDEPGSDIDQNAAQSTVASKAACSCGHVHTHFVSKSGELDYGSGEQPSNPHTARAIQGFYSDIIDAARQLRLDTWNALGLPSVGRRVTRANSQTATSGRLTSPLINSLRLWPVLSGMLFISLITTGLFRSGTGSPGRSAQTGLLR